MALTIRIEQDKSGSVEEHARQAVRMVIRNTFNPYAPRLPEQSDVYMRHYCAEGHQYWAPMSRDDELCPDHRADPVIVARYR